MAHLSYLFDAGIMKEATGIKARRVGFAKLSNRLSTLERIHGYSTIEFFRRFDSGKLGREDEFMAWAGLYHLYLTSLPVRQLMRAEPQPA